MLFFSLRQIYLKTQSILYILLWMSPPFSRQSTRPADIKLLQMIGYLQQKGQLGPVKDLIYLIEIERILKIIQYDQKEITLKILYHLTSEMKCYIKGNKEYIFYDKFFQTLNSYFNHQNVTDFYSYFASLDKKQKLQHKISKEHGLKKVGVITEDYFQGFHNFDGDFYDSIANLLTTKTKDSDEYYFTGFKVKDTLCINAIYSNPKTKCKLYLRNVTLLQQNSTKRPASALVRPMSSKLANKSKNENEKTVTSEIPQTQKVRKLPHQQIKYLNARPSDDLQIGMCSDLIGTIEQDSQIDKEIMENPLVDINLRGDYFQLEQKRPDAPQFGYSDDMYGIAKLMCDWVYESEDEEELDQIDKPFEYPKTAKKGKINTQVKQKSIRYKKQKQEKDDISLIEKREQEKDREDQKLIGILNVPYKSRKINYEFIEFEDEVNDNAYDKNSLELDLSEFGFGSALLLQIYSVNSEIVAGIQISFPDENVSLPIMEFPCIANNDQYDCHQWLIRPIDNIKGIQIQKKLNKYIRNFVLLVQDNEKSRLTEFEFDYMHNVNWKKNKEIIPKLSDEWRMGCFKIYLNFQLNRNEQDEQIIELLKRLSLIFQSLFPNMIVEENVKYIRSNTVFEVFLQGMGRPQQRDSYDRYYLLQLDNWEKLVNKFEEVVTELMDNLMILVWSYDGSKNMEIMEQQLHRRQVSNKSTKNYAYKYIIN